MANRLYGRAAMTAAGLTVLFMAGSAQAQEYEIRGCMPNVETSACCPNLADFPPGSALISNGSICRLDTARNQDVTTTGSVRAPGLFGIPGLGVPGVVTPNGTVNPVTVNPGTVNPGTVTPGQGQGEGPGNGNGRSKDNAGLGNGMEGNDFTQDNPGGLADPDNPGHGGSRDFAGGSDKGGGGDKGGGKGKH